MDDADPVLTRGFGLAADPSGGDEPQVHQGSGEENSGEGEEKSERAGDLSKCVFCRADGGTPGTQENIFL